MKIDVNIDGSAATLTLEGKLSVATSPELEEAVQGLGDGVSNINMDLTHLDYISSVGLRVLVSTEKLCASRGGKMTLKNPNDEVFEVFDMTGLSEVFIIER